MHAIEYGVPSMVCPPSSFSFRGRMNTYYDSAAVHVYVVVVIVSLASSSIIVRYVVSVIDGVLQTQSFVA